MSQTLQLTYHHLCRHSLTSDTLLPSDLNLIQQAVNNGANGGRTISTSTSRTTQCPVLSNGVKEVATSESTVTSTTELGDPTNQALPPTLTVTSPSVKQLGVAKSKAPPPTSPAPAKHTSSISSSACEEVFKSFDGMRQRQRSNTLTNDNVEVTGLNGKAPEEVCRQCSDPINPTLYTHVTQQQPAVAKINKAGSESDLSDNSINIAPSSRHSSGLYTL